LSNSQTVAAPEYAKTGLYVEARNGMRLRHRKVQLLVRKMYRSMPWLEASDQAACRGWAEMEILGSVALSELYLNGISNEQGEPRRLLAVCRQIRQAQLAHERELGVTPAARMAIKSTGTRAALDLAAAMAQRDPGVNEGQDEGGRGRGFER
jgi:hypothetical protein